MLTERQQQQQTAIWELVETEVTYIHTLRVLTDVRIKAYKLFIIKYTQFAIAWCIEIMTPFITKYGTRMHKLFWLC